MYIRKLELKNFRTHRNLILIPNKGLNFFVGKNGVGKTNILESIYYACLTKSQRTNNVTETISFNCKHSIVSVEVQHRLTVNEIKILLTQEKEKKILIDGNPAERNSEILDKLGVVYFCPDDLKMVQDAPIQRRKFLNVGMAMLDIETYNTMQKYKRLILKKNFILKNYPKTTNDELDAWDFEIAKFVFDIIRERKKYIAKVSKIAAEKYDEIAQNGEFLFLDYESSFGEVESVKDVYNKILKERTKEKESGCVIKGPHRDDMLIKLNGEDARKYSSQGQQRSIVLALKLAELEIYEQSKQENAILLLDDVLSELDDNRKKSLIKVINNQQTFLTSTEYAYGFDGYKYEVTKKGSESIVVKKS